MGKPRQRAVDILGLQHQSGRCGSRASGRTSEQTIANGGRPTASRAVRYDNFREALGVFGKSVSLPRQKAITQTFGWGYATVSLNTKKIKGLHENDFVMASKIDRVLNRPDGFLDHKQ
jgi:pterin-4a-carbinolamine dehydratase